MLARSKKRKTMRWSVANGLDLAKTEFLGAGGCRLGIGPIEVYPCSESANVAVAPIATVVTNTSATSSTMLDMNPLSTVYATKRRRRNGKRYAREYLYYFGAKMSVILSSKGIRIGQTSVITIEVYNWCLILKVRWTNYHRGTMLTY